MLVAAVLVVPRAWACGPFFPNAYLIYGGERAVYEMPAASFDAELRNIIKTTPTDLPIGVTQERMSSRAFNSRGDESEKRQATMDADLADLETALTANGIEAVTLTAMLDEYRKMRTAMREMQNGKALQAKTYRESVYEQYYSPGSGLAPFPLTPVPPLDPASFEPLFAKLPSEFAEYARGAIAYCNEDCDAAIAHWNTVMTLPPEQRRKRTVWAAFMTGRALLKKNDTSEAAAAFERVRQLAQEGYDDPLDLAGASVGWQARAEALAGDYVRAIHLYAALLAGGWPEDVQISSESLRWLCRKALDQDPGNTTLVEDPLCRRILTAWILACPHWWYAKARKWLDLVGSAGLTNPLPGADRLAWAAYYAGDMAAAGRWLELAEPEAPYGQWVRSKLLLRDGKLEEALQLLQALPKGPPSENDVVAPASYWRGPEIIAPGKVVYGELGVLLLGKADYTAALDAAVRSGNWLDAAYVAERVLSAEELGQCIASRDGDPDWEQPAQYLYSEPPMSKGDRLRYLLARRLARQGLWEEAAPLYLEIRLYYEAKHGYALVSRPLPEPLRETARQIAVHLRAANGGSVAAPEQARHLFEAAEIIRRQGMELLGTELDPDWCALEGLYALDSASSQRAKDKMKGPVPGHGAAALSEVAVRYISAGPDELARAKQNAPTPDKRFHYRYTAADLMWRCAQLLPDNNAMTARALYEGGMYLKNRDPKAADRFYKALVRRNPNLAIAREADTLRWFPARFTDRVLYTPRPPHISKRKAAFAAGIGGLGLLMLAGIFLLLRLRASQIRGHDT
jgi:hypothetical protein